MLVKFNHCFKNLEFCLENIMKVIINGYGIEEKNMCINM